MTAPTTHRRLTAILCADVVGYSRLMGDDEEATVATLGTYREVFVSRIGEHRGRVVDAKGDAILAEFTSVVDALNSAVAIQSELAGRNAGMPQGRRMDFRIGINLGDVLVQDDAIYGDGVNVAARLESLAEPGGICLSRPVHDQVKAKLKLAFDYLGEQQVKNIAEPVRAYKVRLDAGEAAAEAGGETAPPHPPADRKEPLSLPDKPSIAVLPFVNMSGDPEQEYFSDGITEDLITDLSKLSSLFVIARNSAFTYKGKAVDVRQVGKELGIRYVLEGSVRKAGDRVRITAQLVDAASGEHMWAERYDRKLEDIFDLQDEITRAIATELEVKLVEGEQARVWRRLTDNLEAYDLAMRGRELFRRHGRADIAQGRRLIEKALALDPKFAYAFLQLGWTYILEGISERAESPQQCFERALELGRRVIALDDTLGNAYALLSVASVNSGAYGQAREYAERAVALSPDDTQSNAVISNVLVRLGRGEEALEHIETALRLDPLAPGTYLRFVGAAYRSLGRFEEAIAAYRECLEQVPDHTRAQIGLTLAYMEAGREEEGRAQARHVLRISPGFLSASSTFVTSFQDPAERDHMIALLRKAGLE